MRSLAAIVAVLIIILSLVFLPIEIPDRISMPGRILPVREWLLVRDQDASISALLRDHLEGTVTSYVVNRFERGDVVHFTLQSGLKPPVSVTTGDTLGSLYSNETERQIVELSGALAAARAIQNLYATGEKEPIVSEIRMQLSRAEELAEQQEKIVSRLRKLHERALVADQDLEIAENQMKLYQADIAIAQSQLAAVETGAKPEQIDLARAEIAALNRELETLQGRFRDQTVITPISGVIARSPSGDTLLIVRDTSDFLVVMPVPYRNYSRIEIGDHVDIRLNGTATQLQGHLSGIDQTIHVLSGEQVVFATVLVQNKNAALLPGGITKCTLTRGELTPRAFLLRQLRSLFIW